MPRIQAETVAAHRSQREAMIIAAARALLLERGPGAVTPGAVANEVGLTRTAIYKYFVSGDELLRRIVDDSFAAWHHAVADAVDEATGTPAKIDAYVETTLALGTDGAHRIAVLAGGLPSDESSRARLAQHHHNLSATLANVLDQHGVADATLIADLIDGVLGRAIAQIDAGAAPRTVTATTAQVVRRALDL